VTSMICVSEGSTRAHPTRGHAHAHVLAHVLAHVHLPGFLAGPLVTPTLFSFFRSILQDPSQHTSSRRRRPWARSIPATSIVMTRSDNIDEIWHRTYTQMVSLPSPFFTLSWNTPLVWHISKVQVRLGLTCGRVESSPVESSQIAAVQVLVCSLTFFTCSFFCASGIFSNTCARAWRTDSAGHPFP
jgi:hypothetical protein